LGPLFLEFKAHVETTMEHPLGGKGCTTPNAKLGSTPDKLCLCKAQNMSKWPKGCENTNVFPSKQFKLKSMVKLQDGIWEFWAKKP
jgi:hypothetical protein